MARDRLPELLQHSVSATSSNGALFGDPTNSGNNNHNSKEEWINMSVYSNVNEILSQYSEIKVYLAQIANNVETMNHMSQMINIRNFNENEMDELRSTNLRLCNHLMNRFREFKVNLPANNDYSLEARMKRTLFYGLHRNYLNIWQSNEKCLHHYEQKLKKNLQMHSYIINCNSTEDEIEELIASKATNLFVDNILEQTDKERKTLRDLMQRYNELKKLEKSIEDVHALFIRIQTLVLDQSETIQRVEFHAQQASLHVDKGTDELERAETYQKKACKKKAIIIVVSVIILIILVFVATYL